jgi:hypothetical protein
MHDDLVRMAMWHSAILQHLAVERISFLDTLRWLGAPSTGMKPRQALRRQWVQVSTRRLTSCHSRQSQF